jgi:hypothetical protein
MYDGTPLTMRAPRAVAIWLGILGSMSTAACEVTDLGGCPATVDEAAEMDFDDAIVGGGYAIRFVPSPQLRFRGYDVNLTRPVSDRAMLDTYFLRVEDEIPGIAAGDPVLFIGARTDRAHTLVAGACPPLTVTTEEDVSLERN